MEDYVQREMKQILGTALKNKDASRERFQRGAEISLTAEIKELFRILADEEARHIEKLQILLQALEEDRLDEISSDLALLG
jgi:rubrerythrin